MRASARWHTRGRRIVYCAESPAAALLEILVHFEIENRDLPTAYRWLKLEVPGDLVVERVGPEDLPKTWVDNPVVTRAIGDRWIARSNAPLLAVPSALVPETSNVLINPSHEDAGRVSIIRVIEHVLDPRLLK